jgi:hypothetical protein
MGPTRKRDLAAAVGITAVVCYLLVVFLYRWFPPITLWTGVSLLAVAIAEAMWGYFVRSRIADGQIGIGAGRLDPLAVARSVGIAKASAWVGVLAYLLPRRDTMRVAGEDTAGAVAAALCALALLAAGLWLQHCCKSPEDPDDRHDSYSGAVD